MLYIVATPIGNLEDITYRAARILSEVDMVACEDTRQTLKLMGHLGLSKKLISFHAFSLQKDVERIMQLLKEGKRIALVTDAGTPGISDPGYLLTSACARHGITVTPVPGASAFLTALMASGVPIQEFVYYGFAPAKKGRQTFFAELGTVERTQVFYESKHRLMQGLSLLKATVPMRMIVVAKELTKTFETFYRGTPEQVEAALQDPVSQKGEFAIIVAATGFSFDADNGVRPKQQKRQKYMDKHTEEPVD